MVASKKDAPKRLLFLKLASLTIDCWNATPFRSWLEKSDLSRLTPRVMAIVLPLWRVLAPPVVILAFSTALAPLPSTSTASAGGGHVDRRKEREAERQAGTKLTRAADFADSDETASRALGGAGGGEKEVAKPSNKMATKAPRIVWEGDRLWGVRGRKSQLGGERAVDGVAWEVRVRWRGVGGESSVSRAQTQGERRKVDFSDYEL
mmetsp:Transcript_31772/g.63025  ORF Transcript_31772/g.63025 Transcript_31772/m.63025 type:complete len:206 (-) Transcript_31772:8-625(-)